jgi:hypothetical protein
MVKYDGTLRNSLSEVIQFCYGEDGMDATFLESQSLQTIRLRSETAAHTASHPHASARTPLALPPTQTLSRVPARLAALTASLPIRSHLLPSTLPCLSLRFRTRACRYACPTRVAAHNPSARLHVHTSNSCCRSPSLRSTFAHITWSPLERPSRFTLPTFC